MFVDRLMTIPDTQHWNLESVCFRTCCLRHFRIARICCELASIRSSWKYCTKIERLVPRTWTTWDYSAYNTPLKGPFILNICLICFSFFYVSFNFFIDRRPTIGILIWGPCFNISHLCKVSFSTSSMQHSNQWKLLTCIGLLLQFKYPHTSSSPVCQ